MGQLQLSFRGHRGFLCECIVRGVIAITLMPCTLPSDRSKKEPAYPWKWGPVFVLESTEYFPSRTYNVLNAKHIIVTC